MFGHLFKHWGRIRQASLEWTNPCALDGVEFACHICFQASGTDFSDWFREVPVVTNCFIPCSQQGGSCCWLSQCEGQNPVFRQWCQQMERFLAFCRLAASLSLVFQKALITAPFSPSAPIVVKGHQIGWANGLTLNFQRTGFSFEDGLSLQITVFHGHLQLHLSLIFIVNFTASTSMQVARSLLRNTAAAKWRLKINRGTFLQGFGDIWISDFGIFVPNTVTSRQPDALEVALPWSEDNFTRRPCNCKKPSILLHQKADLADAWWP